MNKTRAQPSIPSPPPTSPFPPATQARLDRAALRVELAQQDLANKQQDTMTAQNVFNQELGRLRGILEAALEEAGLPLDTNVTVRQGRLVLGR